MNEKKNSNILRLKGADFSYRYFHQCFILAFLVLVMIVMSIVSDTFRTAYNYGNLMNSCFGLMMAAMGQFLVILTAGIDISVGSMISLTNCVCVYIMTAIPTTGGAVLAVAAAILTGLVCGAFNGFFVAKLRLPAIIVTIATSAIFTGIALVVMPAPGGIAYKPFCKLLSYKFFDKKVPISFFLAIIVIAVLVVLTNRTSLGKALRAVGGSESASFGTGVNVLRTKFMAYLLCGLFCSFGGLFLTARTSCGDANIGSTYTVYSISATVVGGTLMTGAMGEAYGTACGAVIIYLINNVLNMLDVSSFYQYAIQGLVLILALMVGSFEIRRRER